ncbi:MAG: hypothetical protein DCC58_15955 [Chloroflexi bacterium]|nr:MAG: hypothetical protein DCC58_15955 [Chloroflexota bacterium]
MSVSSQAEHPVVCPNCGASNWATARFCAECGTRLVSEGDLEQAFEAGVADVLGDSAENAVPTAADQMLPAGAATGSSQQPLSSVDAPPVQVGDGAVSAQAGWVESTPQPKPLRQNTALWIVLGILAFILACCCGVSLLVAISAANDTALQRELSLLLVRP